MTTPTEVLTNFAAQHVPKKDAEGVAQRIVNVLATAGYSIHDTKTHVAVPREPHPRLTSMGRAYWRHAMDLYAQETPGEKVSG